MTIPTWESLHLVSEPTILGCSSVLMAESGGALNQLEQHIQAFMEKSNRKLQHMEEWYQNRFRTFHSSPNLYEVQRTESEQRVSGDRYANHQYSDANIHLEHYNENPYAYSYSHPYSQTCPYQVPYIYYYDSTNPGHYYVALSDGSVVLVTTVVAGPTQKDEQATRFRKNGKKRGYFSACRGRIEKPRKHPGCGGNAGRMHHHRIPFGKNHPSCFGKVSTRAEQAVQDDEENPLVVTSSELVEGLFDEIPERTETDLVVQKLIVVSEDSQQEVLEVEDDLEKKSEINEEQVFDNSPQKNETEVLNNKQSVVVISSHQKGVTKKAVHKDEEETVGQLKFENDGIEHG
ncbi:60s ribosomal protein l27a-3 [Nicotiana attenuata]|uniref:60s ribosomal protein l27a-3 n=1 Tax=Nicotiana attenuata TaxID=49451 RepID=A0A1J6JYH7_NICAT|nr:60s ribosomal protein l27a-3 [Nicotiana attenuata]